MTWRMVYSTFIVSFSGGKPTKKLSNICSVWATFVLVQLSAPCDQLDNEFYQIDYRLFKTMFLYDTFSSLTTLLSTWQYFAGQPPLRIHIWHSECPSALNLHMVLRACPAFNPYLAFRAPLCSEALNTKYGPAFNTKYSLKAGGRSEC